MILNDITEYKSGFSNQINILDLIFQVPYKKSIFHFKVKILKILPQ